MVPARKGKAGRRRLRYQPDSDDQPTRNARQASEYLWFWKYSEAGIYSGSQSWGDRSMPEHPGIIHRKIIISYRNCSNGISIPVYRNPTEPNLFIRCRNQFKRYNSNNGYDRYNLTFRNTTRLFDDKLRIDLGS